MIVHNLTAASVDNSFNANSSCHKKVYKISKAVNDVKAHI